MNPEKKFKAGPVAATIWLNNGQSREGKPVEYRTIAIDRVYKDKTGAWKNTNSMRINDLPKAALVLTKAYEYAVLQPKNDVIVEDVI